MRLFIDSTTEADLALLKAAVSAAPKPPAAPAAPAAPKPPAAPAALKPAAAAKPSTPAGGSVGGAVGALGSHVVGTVSNMARSATTKGLEQVKKPQDIKEFEAGEPNEGPAPQILEVNNKEKPVSKSAEATAILLMDAMIKGCDKKGVRLMPDVGVQKAEVTDPKKKSPKGSDRPPGALATAAPASTVKNPAVPGSGSHFNFAIGKAAGDVKKDMEHLTGENKKLAPPSPASQKQATSMFGPSASQQGPAAKQQAVASAGPSSDTKQALASIKPPVSETKQALASIKPSAAPKTTGGATGAVSGAPSGVLTSAPAQPAAAPAAPKKVASMSKSAEATEILKGMIAKANSPANPANEPGPVSGTPHGGNGPGSTTCSITDEESHGGKGEAQSSVSGAAHAGSGPAQQSVSGTPHGGSGPAQTNVSGTSAPGNEGNMDKGEHRRDGTGPWGRGAGPGDGKGCGEENVDKAIQAGSIPRMPRAMAMAMDDWRSATNVMTRGNSRFAKHAGTGPLNGEVLAEVEERAAERTPDYRNGVLKACGGCGRTFTLHKSTDTCPTCSARDGQMMAKSRGGMLIPAGI